MNKYAVIVAGGSGSRMQSDIPKQFLTLKGRPLLMHTIEAFYSHSKETCIIVVLPSEHISFWNELKKDHKFNIPHTCTEGGNTRFNSVQNGLNAIDNSGMVAIHDGARPLIPSELIERCFSDCKTHGNATAAVALKDSIRKVEGNSNRAVDRNDFMIMQTPQTFELESIKKAFEKADNNSFSDDASVFENAGNSIYLTEGDYANFKVTTPEDLILAEAILNSREQ